MFVVSAVLTCPEDPYCNYCFKEDSNYHCKKCQFSYSLDDQCIPASSVENCIFYQDATKCAQCDWGFNLVQSQT